MVEDTGKSREIGKGNPPEEYRFSSTNQPKTRGKRNGYHLKPILKKLLAEVDEKDGLSYAEKFIRSEVVRAVTKGGDSARRVWEYIEGKPEQALELTGKGGGPIVTDDLSRLKPDERQARIDDLIRKRRD